MWKSIEINIQNIETRIQKVALIKMPKKSKYADYKFWFPSKLIKKGSNNYSITLCYTNDFKFALKKYGNGKYNKFKVIDEITISAAELEEVLECMEDCTKEQKTYLIVEEPEKIDKDIEVEKSLINECSECTKDLVEKGYL